MAVRTGSRADARAGRVAVLVWVAALVTVPAVLAGLSMLLAGQGGEPAAPAVRVPTVASPAEPADGPALRRELAAQLAEIVSAAPLTFAADSAELAGKSAESAVRVAEALRGAPGVPVELVGFAADTPGPPATAQLLSERRAGAVADALVAAGVDRARITVIGRGATEPLETLAASRRVEISVP